MGPILWVASEVLEVGLYWKVFSELSFGDRMCHFQDVMIRAISANGKREPPFFYQTPRGPVFGSQRLLVKLTPTPFQNFADDDDRDATLWYVHT